MGLEVTCQCQVDDLTAHTKVLLEARDLIIRTPFRRTIKIADITNAEIAGDQLRLRAGQSVITLTLGSGPAAKWAKRIATPPPSLAHKLGIGHESPAFAIGIINEPVLAEVLHGHTADPGVAKVSLAVVRDDQELDQALTLHQAKMGKAPIWIVHGKGPGATYGETPVRQRMRAQGYRDTKVSAISERLSATRYAAA